MIFFQIFSPRFSDIIRGIFKTLENNKMELFAKIVNGF